VNRSGENAQPKSEEVKKRELEKKKQTGTGKKDEDKFLLLLTLRHHIPRNFAHLER